MCTASYCWYRHVYKKSQDHMLFENHEEELPYASPPSSVTQSTNKEKPPPMIPIPEDSVRSVSSTVITPVRQKNRLELFFSVLCRHINVLDHNMLNFKILVVCPPNLIIMMMMMIGMAMMLQS